MTRHIQLVSDKGGVGVTTTALLLARGFEDSGLTVAIVDEADGDVRAAIGIMHDDNPTQHVTTKVSWCRYGSDISADVVIWDNCKPITNQMQKHTIERYVVVRNCYLSLRNNMNIPCDGVILVMEENRALREQDVASVMRTPIALTIPVNSSIARRLDAGLFSRLPADYTVKPLVPTTK